MTGSTGNESELSALGRLFGLQGFRPWQVPIVRAMMAGRDVVAVLPTGSGKSLCFQFPAFVGTGPTLVISPLISLMQDQVASLRRRGLQAASLTSATSEAEAVRIRRGLAEGLLPILYVSPERLDSSWFRTLLKAHPPARLVVDEAHCISEWGHDFRPAYRQIGTFLAHVGRPPVAAFTATATADTRADIERCLDLRNPFRAVFPTNRRGLRWEVERLSDRTSCADRMAGAVRSVLRASPEAATLVYAPTRTLSVALAEFLLRLGVNAGAYHAGMGDEVRLRVQRLFLSGGIRTVCATSAFGMGIDHPGIRLVCHVGHPGSLESYVQEAGRAGRDGGRATCLLLASPADRRVQAALGRRSAKGRPKDVARHRRLRRRNAKRLGMMIGYVRTAGCRRAYLADYFGEPAPICTGCDRCEAAGQR